MTLKTLAIKYIFNKYFKNWLIDKPYSLQIGEWDGWHAKEKANHPVKYWIQETVPTAITGFWRIHLAWPILDWYWTIIHRFHPNHKYNIIKPRTLKPGYYDSDTRILHAIMEEVVNFYETGCNYSAWRESSDEHDAAFRELQLIYNWWTKLWPLREEKTIWGSDIPQYPNLPTEWGIMGAINEKYSNTPEQKHWSNIATIIHNNEMDWDEMENEMIRRVVDVRKFMWY